MTKSSSSDGGGGGGDGMGSGAGGTIRGFLRTWASGCGVRGANSRNCGKVLFRVSQARFMKALCRFDGLKPMVGVTMGVRKREIGCEEEGDWV
jgi:hypothetical protein